ARGVAAGEAGPGPSGRAAGGTGLAAPSAFLWGEAHTPLAAPAPPAHAAPIDGTSDVTASDVSFATSIVRLGHEARPTAPYPEDVWRELMDSGDRADAALAAAGLEVWIGGEPTFTARNDQARPERSEAGAGDGDGGGAGGRGPGGIEWQGGALGPDKWKRGRTLADELRDRLAPGGAILHRMGKHYPGESLPRWALDVIARRSGG